MSRRNITINDIASSLNVAPSTVSRALNNSSRISEKTRIRVQEKARELGYEINLIASSLSKEETGTIGLIIPGINRFFFSQAASGVESVVRDRGGRLIIAQSNETLEREKEITRMFQSYRVDGVIASLSVETDEVDHLACLQSRNIPVVLFDRVHFGLECTKVVVDNFEGAYRAATHLVKTGCKRPAFIGGPFSSKLFQQRADGFSEALRDHDIPLQPGFLLTTDLTTTDVHDAMRKWMSRSDPPDGIFTASASTGLLVIRIARDYQLGIPDDISIITFGNEPCHEYTHPSLSAIDMPGHDIGATAARHLLDEIRYGSSEHNLVIAPLQLRIRNSTLKKDGWEKP